MSTDVNGRRVAFLATDMVAQVELTEPWKAAEDGNLVMSEPDNLAALCSKLVGLPARTRERVA